MTLEKFLFMMCYKGSKFVKQGNREIEIDIPIMVC